MISTFFTRYRRYHYTTVLPTLLMFIDLGLIWLAFELASYYDLMPGIIRGNAHTLLATIYILSWALSGIVTSIYLIQNLGTYPKILYFSARAGLLYGLLIYFLVAIRLQYQIDYTLLFLFYFTTFVAIVILRIAMLRLYRIYRNLPSHHKKAIIIGYTRRGINLYHFFKKNPNLPNKLIGIFDDKPLLELAGAGLQRGSLRDVQSFCLKNDVKEIYYALSNHTDYLAELSTFADKHFIYLGIIPEVEDIYPTRRIEAQIFDDGRIPVISYRKLPLRLMVNWQIKRLFDIGFSFFVLCILSFTLFPLIALAIWLDSRGPILFKQLRPGRNNQLFWCYKFRTMHINSDEHVQATKNDNRITRIGAFLRQTSLDELPQFFNVLKGDMSVVGPRPNLIIHLEQYGLQIQDYAFRHAITPGITGYAQVNGLRGETKEIALMEKRVEHDLWYMENWSLGFDLEIILLTVINIFKGERNAY